MKAIHRMKAAVALAAVCGLLLAACSAGGSGPAAGDRETEPFVVTPLKQTEYTAEELALLSPLMRAIHERGTLRVAMPNIERFPFFYMDETGAFTGSDVLLAQDLAAQMGVEVEYVRTADTFDGVVRQVATGEADIALSKLSATLSRAGKVLFSEPILTLHQGVVLNRLAAARFSSENADPLEFIRRSEVKIGVVAGTSYVGFAALQFPKAQIVQYDTPQDGMDGVVNDEVAALYYDELQLKTLIRSNPGSSLKVSLSIMEDQVDFISIAVPWDDIRLLSWINLYLRSNQARIDTLLKQFDLD